MNKKLLAILLLITTAIAAAASASYLTRKQCINHAKTVPPLVAAAINTFGVNPIGIIHVGAYTGYEKKEYERLGFKNRLWIEADPDTYKRLIKNVAPDLTANFAATDYDGTAEFLRTNNEVSSSLFELKEHKNVVPDVLAADKIEVATLRLDSYFKDEKMLSNFNIMLFDIQGAELKALSGAINTLKKLDCIILEIQYQELYEGAPTLSQLDAFLLKEGFVRVDTISQNYAWGDALYVKAEKYLKPKAK